MKNSALCSFIFTLLIILSIHSEAQRNKKSNSVSTTLESGLVDSVFSGLKLRNIGPGFMSGRIADIAIHPENENIWYVAVGSGGVWKTENAGITWTPIFDNYGAASIGDIEIYQKDPIKVDINHIIHPYAQVYPNQSRVSSLHFSVLLDRYPGSSL